MITGRGCSVKRFEGKLGFASLGVRWFRVCDSGIFRFREQGLSGLRILDCVESPSNLLPYGYSQ